MYPPSPRKGGCDVVRVVADIAPEEKRGPARTATARGAYLSVADLIRYGMLYISKELSIPMKELRIRAVRSSGPGGQHVNTAATKAVLRFNLAHSRQLTQLQKMILRGKLRRRIGKDGYLTLTCQTHRSFEQNREEILHRFADLLAEALTPVMQRIRSGVPGGERRRRVEAKKRRAAIKKKRGPVSREDW